MNNKKGNFLIISLSLVFAIMIVILGFIIYILYIAEPQEFGFIDDENSSILDENITDYESNNMLFYSNMRFPKKEITYSIDHNCTILRAVDVTEAFDTLQENTVLFFTEVEDGEIKISCSSEVKEITGEHFIAGEGGANTIINTLRYSVILNGTVLLYNENECSKSIVAIHEILHVLGFKHSPNKDSIMYEFSYCDQKLSKEIIDKIAFLYRDPTLPDLVFKNIEASKKGIYLDFDVEVINTGLDTAIASTLSIYSGDRKLETYDLENIELGAGKVIKVNNLRIPYGLENITFIIDEEDRVLELDEVNNQQTLILE